MLLQTSHESDSANILTLTKRELRGGRIRLNYDSPGNDSAMNRTMLLTDADDRELYRREGHRIDLPARKVRRWLKKTDQLIISTMAVPSDPDKAAIVRVRRVILCRLKTGS